MGEVYQNINLLELTNCQNMKLKNFINQLASHENPQCLVYQLLNYFSYIAVGKINAFLLGWKGSFVGGFARVKGTKFISLDGVISIGRFSWIEAILGSSSRDKPIIKFGHRFFASERLHISCVNKITIGDDCLFGSSVYISDHNHGAYKGVNQSSPFSIPVERDLISDGEVWIGNKVWIGDNVVIAGAIKIGSGVIVGANSVLTKSFPDSVMVAGAPARIIRKFNSLTGSWDDAKDGVEENE